MYQSPLFMSASSDWTPPDLTTLPSWAGAKRIAIDCETKDPNLKRLCPGARDPNAHITGISFAIEDGPGAYLPIRHAGGDNLPVDAVLRYVRDQARDFAGTIVCANLQRTMALIRRPTCGCFRHGSWARMARKTRACRLRSFGVRNVRLTSRTCGASMTWNRACCPSC